MDLEYTELPERAESEIAGYMQQTPEEIDAAVARFADVKPRPPDKDGDVEVIDGVSYTHHFVEAPGDSEMLTWHYVETGAGEPVVFLHGLPDSWYEWQHQMAAVGMTHRAIAVDLKGYGQSDKRTGDYRHEGVAEQMFAMFEFIGLDKFNLVAHDRGAVQADWIAADHPDRVLRYCRSEQHLYHFNPKLAPQEAMFIKAPETGSMKNPNRFVAWAYTSVTRHLPPDHKIARAIQEFAYPGVADAVPRYFNSNSFRKEWIDRRTRLLAAWKCPIMILQGYYSRSQPREFYEKSRDYIANAKEVQVKFVDAMHFVFAEAPEETTQAILECLAMEPAQTAHVS